MSMKKMKGVLLLASTLALGVLGGVVSCNEEQKPIDPTPVDPWADFVEDNDITGLEVTNKADLEKEFWVGESDRSVELQITGPVQNVIQLMSQNKLMIVSENTEIAVVNGVKIQAVKEGTAKVVVRAGKSRVEINLEVKQDHLEIGQEYTLEQITGIPNTQKKWFRSTGVIKRWTKGSDGQQFGNFYVSSDWSKDSAEVQVYGATGKTATEGGKYINSSKEEVVVESVLSEKDGTYAFNNVRDWLVNENTKDLKLGDKISFDCIRSDYNGTIEISLWNVRFIEHKDLEVDETAEPSPVVFNSIKDIVDSTVEDKKVKYTGKVLVKSVTNTTYGNLQVTDLDGTNEIQVYGSTMNKESLVWNAINGNYDFTNNKDFNNAVIAGQTIDITCIRDSFNNKKQLNVIIDKVYAPDVTGIAFESKTYEVQAGKSVTVKANLTPAGALGDIKYTIASDSGKVTVDENTGVVSAAEDATNGETATVTAASGTFTATATITVIAPVEEKDLTLYFTGDEKNVTHTTSAYASQGEFTVNDVKFMCFGNGTLPYGLKLGGKSITDTDRYIHNTTAFPQHVTSIVVNHGSPDSGCVVNSFALYVFDDIANIADANKATYTYTGTHQGNGSYTYTPATGDDWSGKFFRINYNVTVSGKKNQGIVITSIAYNY